MQRLSAKDDLLGRDQEGLYRTISKQLAEGTPVQYALGHAWFMGRRYDVNNAVLIPRPETEELVQWIIAEALPTAMIIDIGTGSGCIPISLKLALPGTSITAIDISPAALTVAQKNARSLEASIYCMELDFLTEANWHKLDTYDIIVSNPPYIPAAESNTLHPNVRDHEPGTALFVPSDDALLFYRKIARFGKTHLSPGGAIYCELHQDYAKETGKLFEEAGYKNVRLREDIHGAQRMLRAQS
jgi:release factor glutamine methyltransferase